MKASSQISATNPDYTAQRRCAGPVSRKSVSSDCVKGHDVTGSLGQEVNVADVRLTKSENDTLSGRVTSSRRPSRKTRSRNCRSGPRRHLAASSKQRHVTESSTVTSSGAPRGVTSSGNPRERDATSPGTPAVTSSTGNPETPRRGRTSCKRHHRRTESPDVTSSGKPHEVSASPAAGRPDPRCLVRSTSVPPPCTLAPNPFSPFWNFLFKDRVGADDDHVCNTVRSPRQSWFGGSAIITNVYLSTINRWTGLWPTTHSYLAAVDGQHRAIDGEPAPDNRRSVSHYDSQKVRFRWPTRT